jgi:hypothetical protein
MLPRPIFRFLLCLTVSSFASGMQKNGTSGPTRPQQCGPLPIHIEFLIMGIRKVDEIIGYFSIDVV